MKNILKAFSIIAIAAVIGFSFITCEDDNGGETEDESGGRLLLTDIPEKFNGEYVHLPVMRKEDGSLRLGGFQSYDNLTSTTTYVKIANGKANIPVWIIDGYHVEKYYGSDTVSFVSDEINIYKEATNNEANYTRTGSFYLPDTTVVFVNGFAEKSIKGSWWFIDEH